MLRRFLARWRARPAPVPLRLYTKASCPLCDEMKAVLARARLGWPIELTEVDVEGDPELLARHGRSLPVLEIAGKVAFKGRMQAAELERKFARRLAELRAEAASRTLPPAGESAHD